MTRKISLAYLTVPGMDPLAQVKMASKAGYDYVSLRTIPMGQAGEPQVHLENNPGLFASIQVALEETSLQPLDIELVRVKEDLPRDYRGAFECAAKLGFTDVLPVCGQWIMALPSTATERSVKMPRNLVSP